MSCLTAPTTTEEDVMTESGVCVCVFRPALARTRTVPDAELLIAPAAPSSTCWLIYKVYSSRNLFKGHSTPPQVLPYPFPCPVLSTHAAHGRYPATCQEARSSATYRERKLRRNHSARMETDLIQLGTDFAVETTLMKLSSYAQRDPASPGFHALLPLTQYTTTFRRR